MIFAFSRPDNGIQGHLEDSPPDHHRPIPKSLTASFAQAGIVRDRGLVHGGSAAESAPEDDGGSNDDEEAADKADADDASSVTSSGFMSLAAILAEARLGEETAAAGVSHAVVCCLLPLPVPHANVPRLTYAVGCKSTDADMDMDVIINEADAALRQALQAQGLVVGGADTQERLTEFVTDSLRTTQCVFTAQHVACEGGLPRRLEG